MEKIRALLGIAFDYEELVSGGSQTPGGVAPLSAEKFAQLPRELIQEIRKATKRGNKKLLDELIREVPEPAFAAALQGLADKYEYDALTQLLEEAWRH